MPYAKALTGEQFCEWLHVMRARGDIKLDSDAAALLGISRVALSTMKKTGGDMRTALACRTLFHRLEPWGRER